MNKTFRISFKQVNNDFRVDIFNKFIKFDESYQLKYIVRSP